MKLLKHFSYFILFSVISLHSISAEKPNAEYDDISQQVHFMENELQQAYQLFLQIDQTIEQLAMLVSKHQFKNIIDKDPIITIFVELRGLIKAVLRDQATTDALKQLDPEAQIALQAQITLMLLQLSDELAAYLDKAIKNNLHNLKPFDIEKLTKRSRITEISPAVIDEKLKASQEKIAQLKKNSDTAGLTWYNIATRKFEDTIVNPCLKYNIPTIAGIGGVTTLIGLYFLWSYDDEFTKIIDHKLKNGDKLSAGLSSLEKCASFLKKKFGQPIVISANGHKDFDAEKNGFLSVFDDIAKSVQTTKFGHIALVGGLTYGAYKSAWQTSLKPWLMKRGSVAWNFMRGGAYEQKAIGGQWDFIPEHNFDDMVGLEEVKDAFSFIIRFLDNPEQYLRVNTAPETGYLLTGPTRTGKSFSVDCLCGEIARMLKKRGRSDEFKFWKIDAALINQYGIKDILDTAKSQAPIVLFIDEIDLLGLARVGNNPLLSQFLIAMQSSMDKDPSKQVILIAATNLPETLDSALRQYGRFGKEIRFEYPAFKHRKSYLTEELNNMALDISQFDINTIAYKTEGKSFEDLRAIIRSAMIRSWTYGYQLTQELLEESLDIELNKIIMIDRKDLSDEEKHILAGHFAGRALAMTLLDTHAKLDKVTIKAVMPTLKDATQWDQFYADDKNKQTKIEYGALFTKYLKDTIRLSSHEQTINEVKVLLAGFAAEELLLGSSTYKCHAKNSERAYLILESLVFEGLDPKKLSKNVYQDLANKLHQLFVQYKQEVTQLLAQHRDTLVALTSALAEKGIMTDKDVTAIIDKVENKSSASETTQQDLAAKDTNTKDTVPALIPIEA